MIQVIQRSYFLGKARLYFSRDAALLCGNDCKAKCHGAPSIFQDCFSGSAGSSTVDKGLAQGIWTQKISLVLALFNHFIRPLQHADRNRESDLFGCLRPSYFVSWLGLMPAWRRGPKRVPYRVRVSLS